MSELDETNPVAVAERVLDEELFTIRERRKDAQYALQCLDSQEGMLLGLQARLRQRLGDCVDD